jgi:uncharacterized protein YegJ (DUF2314 family)
MARIAAWTLALALAMATSSCRKGPEPRIERKGNPDFIPTGTDDAEMEAAMRKGRETLPEFVNALLEPPPNSRDFAIKKGFPAEKREEFIWLTEVKLAKDGFRAVIGNAPVWAADLQLGDSVAVKRDEVVDWMYVRNNQLVGGFTVRVLFNREPPAKQREMEKEALFTIPR